MSNTIVPTDEQNNVCEMSLIHRLMKISAYAGAAKTSTLCMVAEKLVVPSLMLTFNKSLAVEAKERFLAGLSAAQLTVWHTRHLVHNFRRN